MEITLHNRRAIVTGAAHGFGRAICVALSEAGAEVWGCDLLHDELAETVRLCQAAGGSCHARRVDITSDTAVQTFVQEAEAGGAIDILVNNAGGVVGQVGQPVETVSSEAWAAVMAVNLTGTFYLIRAVASGMKRQRYGRIINISSGAGRSVSLTGIQAYASAKAGQIGLTRQMAHELGPWGVTVNNIAPGFVLSNPATQRQWDSYSAQEQQAIVNGTALRRLGRAEDIAHGVLFFASELAEWCTGQTISIDGGHALF